MEVGYLLMLKIEGRGFNGFYALKRIIQAGFSFEK